MAFRKKMSRGQSKKNFRRGAKTKKRNFSVNVMRGGYRI
jgi:hypothetical protein